MQDFAPFTPELLGALSAPPTPGRKDHHASEVGNDILRVGKSRQSKFIFHQYVKFLNKCVPRLSYLKIS